MAARSAHNRVSMLGAESGGSLGTRGFGTEYDSRVADAATQIEQLRKYRQRPEREVSIARLVGSLADDARRTQRRLGSLIDLWSELVPAELEGHSRIVGVRGGIGHVQCDSASTRYELDRALRQGLEQELRRRYPSTLMKIRLSVADFERGS